MKRFKHVYQFRIQLKEIKPPIWRRIQVSEVYTFWDLHVAIQDAMGWLDYHLHEFTIKNPSFGEKVQIGMPSDEGDWRDEPLLTDWEQKIAAYFTIENSTASYLYDFGDDWEHSIKLERIQPRGKDVSYPICLAGKRACPPEDCGGIWGYENLLEIIKDPEHEEHEEMMQWLKDNDIKTIYIDPGSLWQNGYIESFHSRFRDECLDREILLNLREARVVIEDWRQHYNQERPHSRLGYQSEAFIEAEMNPILSHEVG